ncbi:MAG TPA: NAD-dependent epimerase/dehydratase family protein [Acidimicrobiales bacterium]|nr:NAD-dependent epimerase/dehydratase family protein [Acidimicrobiales bacterium]
MITGGAGFLGQVLAARLLSRGQLVGRAGQLEAIDEIVLIDRVAPAVPGTDLGARVRLVTGDVTDEELVRAEVVCDDVSVFHLASMVSAECEQDFDGALAANIGGCRAVLEACRACRAAPRMVFSSSIAVFGGLAPDEVATDGTKLLPATTYGTTKAICELLVNDYTRKGHVDGRSARLPTVIIRPGRPNAAASSWVSSIFRERLNGEECTLPVGAATRVPVIGYRTVAENLARLHDVRPDDLGADRAVNLPSLDLTAHEMMAALDAIAPRPLGPVSARPDPKIIAVFETWAQHSSALRANRLGLCRDDSVAEIVHAYLEDFPSAGP